MSSSYDRSFTSAKAAARAPQRRRVHGGSASQPPMAFDVGPTPAPRAAPSARTWRSTVVGAAIGFGIVLAFAMKWLMSYQIDSAEERRVQQRAVRAAAARCYDQASNAAINACLKELEARSARVP